MQQAPLRSTSFFFSSRRRHTRYWRDWSSDVCSSDLGDCGGAAGHRLPRARHGIEILLMMFHDPGHVEGRDLELLSELVEHVQEVLRSEERRVGKECISRLSPYQ